MAADAAGHPTPARARLDAIARHPAATIAVVGTVLAIANVLWFARFRQLGSFNIDEAGYLGNALRAERELGFDLRRSLVGLGGPSTAPLVPVASVPLLVVGPRTVLVAWSIQQVFYVVTAAAVAALAHRLADASAALVAGVVVLGLPAAVVASRSYQFAPAVAASLALALWALIASDRGRDTWRMVGFGAAVAAMLLSRTMAVAFLPALALGAVVQLERSRLAARNLVLAASTTLLIAGPWWAVQWSQITEYLVGYGFGEEAAGFGATTWGGRVSQRLALIRSDLGWPLVVLTGASLLVAALAASRRPRGRHADQTEPAAHDGAAAATVDLADRHRSRATVAATVGLGALTLFATSNRGTWFELPLEAVAVALIVAVVADAAPPVRRTLAGFAVALALLSFGVSLTHGWGRLPSPRAVLHRGADVALISAADPRFASTDEATRRQAADAWWRATTELVDALERRRTRRGPLQVTISGSSVLANTQVVFLASELRGAPFEGLDAPDTSDPDAGLAEYLTPDAEGRSRVIVIIEMRAAAPAGPEAGRDRFERAALDAGWVVRSAIALPDGGEARILDHPAAAP